MGIALVGAALNPHWSRLTAEDRMVLITMANSAYDKPRHGRPGREYWGGQQYLIIVLTGTDPEPGTAQFDTAKKRIQRSIQRLIQAGAIERIGIATGRKRARYRLLLDEFNQPTLLDPDPDDA